MKCKGFLSTVFSDKNTENRKSRQHPADGTLQSPLPIASEPHTYAQCVNRMHRTWQVATVSAPPRDRRPITESVQPTGTGTTLITSRNAKNYSNNPALAVDPHMQMPITKNYKARPRADGNYRLETGRMDRGHKIMAKDTG